MTIRAAVTLALLALGAFGAAACGSDNPGPGACNVAVTFAPAEPRLATGDSLLLSADLSRSAGCSPAGATLTWISSDPAVIEIDDATGMARARAAGTARITVRETGAAFALDSVTAVGFAPLFDRIIFTRQGPCQEVCPPLELWTMNAAGSDLALAVDSLHYPEHPRVSPDGKWIVVEDWGHLVITDAGGGARRVLASGVTDAFWPSWSADGRWILYGGGTSLNPPWQVYLIHPDGTGRRQITNVALGTHSPAWSPDGRIVFMRYYAIGLGPVLGEAVVMDTMGTVQQVLTTGIAGFNGYDPDWSPDGESILFLGTTGHGWIITKLTLAGTTYDTLGYAQGNRPGDWSPDGQRILYGTGDLWTMAPDGTDQRLLLSDGYSNFEAAWTPKAPSGP
jgi:Tol biopolymer transport system component